MRQLAGEKGNIVHYMGENSEPKMACWDFGAQSEVTQREATRGLAWPFSIGEHTVFLLEREDLGTSLLLCPGMMFRQGN